ncbi:hypothetical protein [Naasia aerilata]|uniref:Uncharacterized protein n=1 Tax=Naasia aerilata TaxID=1162966 RepID=A0ABM8G866_9MICO|nr:hypothetical protein [Naasia aerilata]BDZ44373.1 hypothetical protein GCM10025866_02820 [Naasia aerilata]
MKHLTYSNKSMLVGDIAADLMVEYAATLAHKRDGDTVSLNVINADGNEAEAIFLLDTGAPLMAETVNSSLPEPGNAEAEAYMRGQIMERSDPSPAASQDQETSSAYEHFDFDTAAPVEID